MKTAEEFWARVDRTGNGCHEWLGSKNNTGYGTLIWHDKAATAHRVAAFLAGLVPEVAAPKDRKGGGFVMHSCDNRACCNPTHFEIGTYSRNQSDAYQRNRRAPFRGETHAGAKLTDEQADEIRRRWPAERQVDLAAEFGVSQGAISLITRGVTYKCN